MSEYVHGYSNFESNRLNDQADTLAELLHRDSVWEDGSVILEAGCGVGAQIKTVAPMNKNSKFISVDISFDSIQQATRLAKSLEIDNVQFKQADIFNLPFTDDYFDHVFVCFVLEHLPNPIEAIHQLKRVLKPNGTMTIIEGDHGSTYFHPDSKAAKKAIRCQVELQKSNGGDANIGRSVYPILKKTGFENVQVSPRQVYVDDSYPNLIEGFTKNTFIAMIEGISEHAISNSLISREEMSRGISDLYKTTEGGGTFCYTFFKGIGKKPQFE